MASIVIPAVLRFSRVMSDNLYQINKSLNRRRQHFSTITEENKELIKEQQKLIKKIKEHQERIKKEHQYIDKIIKESEQEDFIIEIQTAQYIIEDHQKSMIMQQELIKELAEWQLKESI